MSLMKVFNISGSAVSAQSQRLNVVVSNLANAEAVAGPDGQSYKARQVVFQSTPAPDGSAGVRVSTIAEDAAPPKRVFEPGHPMADAQGYVRLPEIDLGEQMTTMVMAQRGYQASVSNLTRVKACYDAAIQMGRG